MMVHRKKIVAKYIVVVKKLKRESRRIISMEGSEGRGQDPYLN